MTHYIIYRYLIDTRWFKQWKKYVGYDGDNTYVGKKGSDPGPIDNSQLFKGKYLQLLKPSMVYTGSSNLCFIT